MQVQLWGWKKIFLLQLLVSLQLLQHQLMLLDGCSTGSATERCENSKQLCDRMLLMCEHSLLAGFSGLLLAMPPAR